MGVKTGSTYSTGNKTPLKNVSTEAMIKELAKRECVKLNKTKEEYILKINRKELFEI